MSEENGINNEYVKVVNINGVLKYLSDRDADSIPHLINLETFEVDNLNYLIRDSLYTSWDGFDYKPKQISFQFHITDRYIKPEDVEEEYMERIMGKSMETSYYHTYSEITGYLWTTNEVKIGKHDVIKRIEDVFSSYSGSKEFRYIYITIIIQGRKTPINQRGNAKRKKK